MTWIPELTLRRKIANPNPKIEGRHDLVTAYKPFAAEVQQDAKVCGAFPELGAPMHGGMYGNVQYFNNL